MIDAHYRRKLLAGQRPTAGLAQHVPHAAGFLVCDAAAVRRKGQTPALKRARVRMRRSHVAPICDAGFARFLRFVREPSRGFS